MLQNPQPFKASQETSNSLFSEFEKGKSQAISKKMISNSIPGGSSKNNIAPIPSQTIQIETSPDTATLSMKADYFDDQLNGDLQDPQKKPNPRAGLTSLTGTMVLIFGVGPFLCTTAVLLWPQFFHLFGVNPMDAS